MNRSVFADATGARWRRLKRAAFALAFVATVLGTLFSFSLLALHVAPLRLPYKLYSNSLLPRLDSRDEAAARFLQHRSQARLERLIAEEARHRRRKPSPAGACSTVVAFYVNWEPGGLTSLREHAGALTYLMPEWLFLKATSRASGIGLGSYYNSKLGDGEVVEIAARHRVPILPVVNNYDPAAGRFTWEPLRRVLTDRAARQQFVDATKAYVLRNRFGGVNLDMEPPYSSMTPAQSKEAARLMRHSFLALLAAFRAAFSPQHLLVTVDVAPNDQSLDYENIANVADLTVVMLYDQHTGETDPGPIAGQDWVQDACDRLFSKADNTRVVLGLGNYCFDWTVKRAANGDLVPATDSDGRNIAGRKLLLSDALTIARESGARLQMDDGDLNPYFAYSDESGRDHIVYLLDATTVYNELKALRGYAPAGAALWYLGSEDPTIWPFFAEGKLNKPLSASGLEAVTYRTQTTREGDGEIMQVAAVPEPGHRILRTNADGLIVSQTYTRYPSPFVVKHFGSAGKKIALTFDDGPDQQYTPPILDILRNNHVPATFFVIGENAESSPWLLSREWADGDEIGNHTFSHPALPSVSPLRAQLELNATQRIIESATVHSTRLFRPPFGDGADSELSTVDVRQADLLERTGRLGYLTVGMKIDPKDWTRPGADRIVQRVLVALSASRDPGNVILLHDGGGDRQDTVDALPDLIRELRNRGYQFVRVSDLLGPESHASLFPAVSSAQMRFVGLDRAVFEVNYLTSRTMKIAFLLAIVLGILRLLLVGPLAFIQSRSAARANARTFSSPVTVIIPSYNEDRVICRTIEHVLNGDYANLDILVIDDGSTDDTERVVLREYGSHPKVRYVRKENGGKASALNVGLAMTSSEVVVCLDADTIFASDTVSRLVSQFDDPRVGAVAGNVKVGNRINPLTIWQSVEYITSQNFDRRAYAALNSVSVVPGAVGAWRREAMLEAGGFDTDTLAEDCDLTFKVRKLGYDVRTENNAVAYTEAPDTLKMLAKQRFRWAFGIMQCLWKHREMTLNRRYGAFGMVVLPAMWVFNIGFQALSPIVDVMAVLAVLDGQVGPVLLFFGLFFVADFAVSAIAFRLDREDLRQLVWLFWQRFFYRQFMYYVILKALVAALKGGAVGWGKLQRKATATLPAGG